MKLKKVFLPAANLFQEVVEQCHFLEKFSKRCEL